MYLYCLQCVTSKIVVHSQVQLTEIIQFKKSFKNYITAESSTYCSMGILYVLIYSCNWINLWLFYFFMEGSLRAMVTISGTSWTQSHSHTVTQSHRPVRLVLAVFVLWNKILSDTNHLNGMQLLIISSAEGGYVFTCVCLLVCLVKSCGKMIRSRNLISLFVKFVDGNFEWVPRGTVGPWWRWATFYLSLSIGGAASDEANQANV